MYEMYPEWGPAKNRDEDTAEATQGVQRAFDRRDTFGPRPDDN